MKKIQKQTVLTGAEGRLFALDTTYSKNGQPKPVVVFAHGFKGFKDWGHWGAIAEAFAEAGFVFVKFNFSHNGVTVDQPLDFVNLEAFGQNNYMKELTDLDAVVDALFEEKILATTEIDLRNVSLIGHSRSGPIVILKAAQDERISKVITWAAVHQLNYAWTDEAQIEYWREAGVNYILNGRTKQQMPLYFQLYENFKANENLLNTETALSSLNKPMLIIHGSSDPAVPISSAEQLKRWKKDAILHTIEGGNHVFGGRHPFEDKILPEHSIKLVEKSVFFVRNKKIIN